MGDAIQHFPLFVLAGLLLNITPGADMALVASQAARNGWRAGAAAALGVGAGGGVHILAAALGLSALLAASPWAYTALRWAGAAYLVWLGWSLWRRAATTAVTTGGPADPCAARTASADTWPRVFAQGFLTNALNPKVALFFLAFVPQFIVPQAGLQAGQQAAAFVLLGLVFTVNGTLVNLTVAALVSGVARRLAGSSATERLGRWLQRGVGGAMVLLGLRLALDGGSAAVPPGP